MHVQPSVLLLLSCCSFLPGFQIGYGFVTVLGSVTKVHPSHWIIHWFVGFWACLSARSSQNDQINGVRYSTSDNVHSSCPW